MTESDGHSVTTVPGPEAGPFQYGNTSPSIVDATQPYDCASEGPPLGGLLDGAPQKPELCEPAMNSR